MSGSPGPGSQTTRPVILSPNSRASGRRRPSRGSARTTTEDSSLPSNSPTSMGPRSRLACWRSEPSLASCTPSAERERYLSTPEQPIAGGPFMTSTGFRRPSSCMDAGSTRDSPTWNKRRPPTTGSSVIRSMSPSALSSSGRQTRPTSSPEQASFRNAISRDADSKIFGRKERWSPSSSPPSRTATVERSSSAGWRARTRLNAWRARSPGSRQRTFLMRSLASHSSSSKTSRSPQLGGRLSIVRVEMLQLLVCTRAQIQ